MPPENRMSDAGARAGDAETAGVALPPPLLFATGLAIGLGAGRAAWDERRAAVFARSLGTASVVAGIAIGVAALGELRRAGTHSNPYRPASTLVTRGPFRLSRNPAYVGATSIYIGIAMFARSLPAFVILPIVLALLDRLVVTPEERYLERRFGDEYSAYRQTVARWF